MSVILERAADTRPEILQMADAIMREHHPELCLGRNEYPRLCIMLAENSEGDDPPVKCHGYPCAAVIRVIPYKQRVDKRADAEIVIDRRRWDDELTEPQQRALLDHEITHLEVLKDENGFVKTDDLGRPKLKLKLHDFDFGGFRSVARRYGSDALEVIAARQFREDFGGDVYAHETIFA